MDVIEGDSTYGALEFLFDDLHIRHLARLQRQFDGTAIGIETPVGAPKMLPAGAIPIEPCNLKLFMTYAAPDLIADVQGPASSVVLPCPVTDPLNVALTRYSRDVSDVVSGIDGRLNFVTRRDGKRPAFRGR